MLSGGYFAGLARGACEAACRHISISHWAQCSQLGDLCAQPLKAKVGSVEADRIRWSSHLRANQIGSIGANKSP